MSWLIKTKLFLSFMIPKKKKKKKSKARRLQQNMPPKINPNRSAAGPRRTQTESIQGGSSAASNPQSQNVGSGATSEAGPSRRPGVQRLQSLKKPTQRSGSISPAARPPPLKTEPSKPTLKYQPRAVGRRSKEERATIEKVESERHQERLAEAAAKQRGRGGAQRGGGRGGGSARGGARRGRGGIVLTSDSRQSSISRRSQTRSIIEVSNQTSNSEGISSDESDSEVRMSIDRINLESDNEFEPRDDTKGKKTAKFMPRNPATGLRPVRVPWLEHEERVVSVNMESSSNKPAQQNKEASGLPDDQNNTGRQIRSGSNNKVDEENDLFVPEGDESGAPGARVKDEPMDAEDEGLGAIPHTADTENEERRQQQEQSKPIQQPDTAAKEEEGTRTGLHTKEENDEFERHETDLKAMKELFTNPTVENAPITSDPTDQTEDKPDKLAGQLFLMQFPPMTPNLTVPGREGEGTTEQERNVDTNNDETDYGGGTAVKREGGNNGVTTEIIEPFEEPVPETAGPPPQVVTATDRRLGAGRVGKLNVHASGRVTMDWGGISMELDRATVVEFLQEALIVSRDDELDVENGEAEDERTVWAMGQLSGKFTITPSMIAL